jgi:two-component system OmpR family sensor kinase
MKFRQSIRWRIQAWHGALLVAVIAAFCVTTYRLQESNARRRGDVALDARLSTLTGMLGRRGMPGPPPRRPEGPPADGLGPQGDQGAPPTRGLPPNAELPPPRREGGPPRDPDRGPGPDVFEAPEVTSLFNARDEAPFYFCVWTRNGPLLAKSERAPNNVPRPKSTERASLEKMTRDRAGFREMYTFTPPGECLLVGQSAAPVEREMRDFAWKLAAISAGILAIGLAGGWALASRAIRPIAQISNAASRIAAGHLAERIHTSETESELGRLAAVLDDTFQRLDAAFAEQARFTSDAAHELRTPVSIILGQAQLALGRERSAQEYRATIETCQRAAKRMHGLIESLLQLSVLDAAKNPLARRPCDLADLSREHFEMMRPLAAEKRIELEADLAPASCFADAGGISQIIVNLLTNAVKYSRSGDKVRVSTHRENGCAILSVTDTGPGIAATHLPHLFERFYRADASRNRTTGGAGLGLAICKSIAEAHGGKLTVESTPDVGSCFTLRIPAGLESPPAPSSESREKEVRD